MNKIADIVMYYAEAEMYRARLEYLSPVVDEFVVLEGDRTHSNVPRGIHLPDDLMEEVIHIYAPLPTEEGRGANWQRVWAHRNSQSHYIRWLSQMPDAKDWLVMFSDLDEFPNVELVKEFKEEKTERAREWCGKLRAGHVGNFLGEMYYYNPLVLSAGGWVGTRIATVETLLRHTAQACRHDTKRLGIPDFPIPKPFEEMPCIANPDCEDEEIGVVHATYFGEPGREAEFVREKMLSVAESTGYVTDDMVDLDKLRRNIANAEDPYGREKEIYYRLEKPRRSMPEPIIRRFMK